MPLVIKKEEQPAWKSMVKNLKEGVEDFFKIEVPRNKQRVKEFVKDYRNGLDTLRVLLPQWWRQYKQDTYEFGLRNPGDWAKWILKNIAGAGMAVIGGKFLSISLGAKGLLGGLARFAFNTSAFMTAVTLQPMVSSIFQTAIQAGGQALNFDIMQTDEALYKQIDERIKGFYGLFGQTVGSAIGWLVCGALPNSLMFRYNKAVAVAIAQDLEPDARAEMYAYLSQIISLTGRTILNAEAVNRYTSLRRELKRNPDTPFAKFVRRTIGEKRFRDWGNENQQPWTIKKDIIDKRIEQEKDPGWKSFYENALEGMTDACLEAGSIIAQNLDTYIATQKIARTNMLGRVQTVRIKFGENVRNYAYGT